MHILEVKNMKNNIVKLKDILKSKIDTIDSWLDFCLEKKIKNPEIIHKAMRYSVFNGGKRLRPILCSLIYEMYKKNNVNDEDLKFLASGIEMIHCYSLIHDDLPALDNDDYRRGKLTCHKKFGEDIAILAGDALLTKSFECFANIKDTLSLKNILLEITDAVGTLGMIGGQVVDLKSEKFTLTEQNKNKAKNLLKYIHKNKTGKLLRTSLLSGAILAKADEKNLFLIEAYSESLGYMFQITDDILDIVGNKKLLGKKGSDSDNQKLTYPAVYGLENSYRIVKDYKKKGFKSVDSMDISNENKDFLKNFLEYIETRKF